MIMTCPRPKLHRLAAPTLCTLAMLGTACSSSEEPGASTTAGGSSAVGPTTATGSNATGSPVTTASNANAATTSSSASSSNTVGGATATNGSPTTGATSGGGASSVGTTGFTNGAGGNTSMGGANGTSGTDGETTNGSTTGGMTPSSGCGMAPPQSGRFDIDVGGMTREYILRVPDSYDENRAYPLIFVWHPWGGSAQQAAGNGPSGYHGLPGVAGDAAIMVAGEGIDYMGNGLGWENPNGRDENFMRAMLERFSSELCVDTSRVFSTGFSFGGMMSFALGCSAGDVIRAIAPQAGNTISGCGDGDEPVAMMGFHGMQDSVVSIESGRSARDRIIERNGCSDTTTTLESSWCDVAGGNSQPCTCVSYDGCMEGYPVIWCEFTGPHTPAPNAGQTLWDFFSQF